MFAFILSPAVREVRGLPLAIFTAILAFLGGSFSEAGNAILTAMLSGYVFACLVYRRRKWAKDTFPIAIVALFASLAAMAVLIASPTTSYRLGLYETPASPAEFSRLLLYYTYEFLALNILNMPWTHLAIFGTLLLVGGQFFPQCVH
jgi:hypothetical protein